MKIVYTHQTLDHSTGELIESKFVKKEVKTTEEFVMMYMKHISLMAKLSKTQLQTLLCIAPCIEWNTGDFTLDSKTMDKITSCNGLNQKSIRNAISTLCQKNIVQRVKTNWYKLNPEIFWKGTELERQKAFELTYRWEIV